MHTGCIGLGNLGKAIAQRLISQGEHLVVWNRTLEKTTGLACTVAESARKAAEQADVLILNLFDSTAVREVLTGPKGVLQADMVGKTVVDTTTNHFREVLEFHRMVSEAGGHYLEAPVMGSVGPASQGALVMLVSGNQRDLERVTPLLRKFCKAIYAMGAPGLASRMKLVNNLVLGSYMAALAEAVALGEAAGIEKVRSLDILSHGAGNSMILTAKKEKLLNGDFSPQFSISAIEKDMRYVADLAKETGSQLSVGTCVFDLFRKACREGVQREDFSAVYKILRG